MISHFLRRLLLKGQVFDLECADEMWSISG